MRILLIGGTGFIGLPTTKHLQQMGHTVAVFSRGKNTADTQENIHAIQGDIINLDMWSNEFTEFNPDVVCHCLIMTEDDAKQAVRVFTGLTDWLIMISSMDVYQVYARFQGQQVDTAITYPIVETSPLRNHWYPYRNSVAEDATHPLWNYDKIPAEQIVMSADIAATVLRLPMVYGKHDSQRRLLPYLRPMLDNRPGIVLGNSQAYWRMTYDYVENIAEAIALACIHEATRNTVYNIGQQVLSTLELVKIIQAVTNWAGDVVIVPDDELPDALQSAHNYDVDIVVSDERFRNATGFLPSVSLRRAVETTVIWQREHVDPTIDYAQQLHYAAQDAILNHR